MSNSVTLWAANSAGFPVLRYLPEFAWILVHWVSDAIQPSHPLLPSSSPPSSVFLSIRVFSSDSALCISGQTIRASALIPPMNIQTTGWHWKLEFPNLRVLFKKVTLCARIHVSLCRSHFLCCLPFAFTSWCFYLKDKHKSISEKNQLSHFVCLTLCDPIGSSMPGFPVHHELPKLTSSWPSSQWCHPTISSSVILFSSCPQSFPASGSFPVSQFSTSCGQSIGVSASTSVLPMNIQDWFPIRLTGLIFLRPRGS